MSIEINHITKQYGEQLALNDVTLTLPEVGGMKQVMIFISVDLPAPLGPSSPTIPLLIESVTSLRASCSPYCLVIWLISMDICIRIGLQK